MSSRFSIWCGALAIAATVELAAQTPVRSQAPPAEKSLAGVQASIVVTGCLERWTTEAAPSPNGGPPDDAPAGVEFVVTRVEPAAPGASATAGSAARSRTGRYLLLGSPTMNFAPHLNHTVKVIGTIAPQPSEGASAADRAADPSRSETNLPAGPTAEAFRLNLVEVSSLETVARSCSR